MDILRVIGTNGFILIMPVLVWNLFLAKKLPPVYQPESFHKDIPLFISTGESVGRILVFMLPLFFKISISGKFACTGWVLYFSGLAIYFLSWIFEIRFPLSSWSKSLPGFTAPAYTIIIWLSGIAFLSDSLYFSFPWFRFFYFIPALVMTGFHTAHGVVVWRRTRH